MHIVIAFQLHFKISYYEGPRGQKDLEMYATCHLLAYADQLILLTM
jgi:hypothetical protein